MSKTIFASGGDNIKIWNGDDMTVIKEFSHQNETVSNINWNTTNEVLLSTSRKGGQIRLSSVNLDSTKNCELLGIYGEGDDQSCACFSGDNFEIVSGGACGSIYKYNISGKGAMKKFDSGPRDPIKCITLNDAETKVIVGNTTGNILLWDVNTASYEGKMELGGSKNAAIRGLQVKRSTVGSVGDSGSVCLWDSNKMKLKHEFSKAHSAPAMDLSFSPLNNLLMVSCGLDKKIVLHDIQGKAPIRVITVDHPLTSVCLASNGVNLFAGTFLGKLYKYDLRHDSKYISVVKAHEEGVHCLIRQFSAGKRKSSHPDSTSNATFESKTSDANSFESNSKHNSFRATPNISAKLDPNKSKPVGQGKPITTPIPNGKSPAKHSLLRQTLGNSTISSRDSLGSYCEDGMSPIRRDILLTTPASAKSNNLSSGLLQNNNLSSITGTTSSSKFSNFNTPNSGIKPSRNVRKSSTPMSSNLQDINENAEPLHEVFTSPEEVPKIKKSAKVDVVQTSRLTNGHSETNLVSLEVLNEALKAQSELFQNALKQQSEVMLSAMQKHADDMHDKNVNSHNHHLNEVSKLLFKQQQKYKELIQQNSLNPVLLAENERLRIENERLQNYY